MSGKGGLKLLAKLCGVAIRTSPGGIVALTALAPLVGCSPALISWSSKRLADDTLSFLDKPDSADAAHALVYSLLLLGLVRLVPEIIQGLHSHLRTVVGKRLSMKMEDKLIAKEIAFPIEVYDDADYLDRLTRTKSNAQNMPGHLLRVALDILQNLLTLGSSLILLASTSYLLPLLGAASASIAMYSSGKIARNKYLLARGRTQRIRRETYVRSLLSGRHNMAYNLLFGLLDFFVKQYKHHRDTTLSEDIRENWISTCLTVAATGAVTSLYIAAYGLSVYLVMSSKGSYGTVLMCTMLYNQTELSLQRISGGLVAFYEQRLFMEDLFAVLEDKRSRSCPTIQSGAPKPIQTISFENVCFRYPGCEKETLKGVSFSLCRDEVTCLVGLNGAGKTTIINLLTRLYKPTEGVILIDGIDLNLIPEEDVFAMFGVITQVLPSYYYSLRENIHFGDLRRTVHNDDHFRTCCKEHGLESLSGALPQGYDTLLGRTFYGGEELSYGQWKSIALARLQYKNAPVRVYDEPTAGLDPIAEQRIIDQIVMSKKNHLNLVVSHTMTVAKEADHILLVKEGRIIERGNHKALIDIAGVYAGMFQAQAQRYSTDVPSNVSR